MKRLWTEETVTFHGKYWTLEDVHPHLFPVQKPHPPIWIGAHAIPGVRRAAKYGDAYACPPETPKDEVARRYAIVRDGFEARGKTFGPQPLRRNILVADTREEAMVEYARVAQGRYLTYAPKGLDVITHEQPREGVRQGRRRARRHRHPGRVVARSSTTSPRCRSTR